MKKLEVRNYLNEILLENGVSEDVKEIYCVSMCNGGGEGMEIEDEKWMSRSEWLDWEVDFWFEEGVDDVECCEEFGNKMVGSFSYMNFGKGVEELNKEIGEDWYEESEYVKENNLRGVLKSNDGEYCEVWFYIK